jgi:hypothetical protein
MRSRTMPTVLSAAIAFAFLAVGLKPLAAETNSMQIRIKTDGTELTATLIDNSTSRDFVSLLPLNLTLQDYGETEKISYLARKLSTEGAPPGSDPSVGDISYFAPWGNLAIFRKNFRYSVGLITLGKIDSGVDVLNVPGPMRVSIELIQKPR